MKRPKPNNSWRRKAAAVGMAGTVLGSVLWFTVGKDKFALPATEAVRVIDGDTFETAEGQHVRLTSTEAPDLKFCGGEEAKARLEKLVLNQPLYVKTVYVDWWKRPVAYVYRQKTLVNEVMLAEGLSEYERSSAGEIGAALLKATETAREQKRGIFSEKCSPKVNRDHPNCQIKGNLGREDKIYYRPDCGLYPNVELELYKGEEWFCTEAAAIKAGFRKPAQCP